MLYPLNKFNIYVHTLLGALLVDDDSIGNEGAWAALGQSLGFMFS